MANRRSGQLLLIRATVALQCAALGATAVTYAERSLRTPPSRGFNFGIDASRFFDALLAVSYATALFLVLTPVLFLRAGCRSAWICLLINEIASVLIIAIFPGLQVFGRGISSSNQALLGYGSTVVITVTALVMPTVRRWAGVVAPPTRHFDRV